jgi:anthranilate synthase/aminodeoxychorismate synthase-like glutamine amidotransferase
VRVLLLENDDSYSWNVVDCLRSAGAEVQFVPGREHAAIKSLIPEFEAVVIGPGPLDPRRAGLMKSVELVLESGLPTLGICLGHQAIGLAFGAELVRAEPAHGLLSNIEFHQSRFFNQLTGATPVMRYHSLALTGIQSPLRLTAVTSDGIAMAIEHESLPIAGLQFHPDSFATPRGAEMVAAFLRTAR